MRAFVMAGLLAAFSGVAHARQEPVWMQDEYCIYRKLTDTLDYEAVAEAYLSGTERDENIRKLLTAAADVCNAELTEGMTDVQRQIAAEIGIYGATADYLVEDLMFDGVTDDQIGGMFAVLEDMSEDEVGVLAKAEWRNDAAVVDRMKSALIAKGVPERDFTINTALQIIELAALALEASSLYAIAGYLDEIP